MNQLLYWQPNQLVEIELAKLTLAMLLGGVIGWQREHTGHEAGIRTFSSVCLGSCLFGIISYTVGPHGDPGRIAAQVVSGMGFMGIGVIIRDGASVKGLTTAATLWSTSAIGLAVAYNLYVLAMLATLLMFLSLYLSRTRFWRYIARRPENAPPPASPSTGLAVILRPVAEPSPAIEESYVAQTDAQEQAQNNKTPTNSQD